MMVLSSSTLTPVDDLEWSKISDLGWKLDDAKWKIRKLQGNVKEDQESFTRWRLRLMASYRLARLEKMMMMMVVMMIYLLYKIY